MSDNWIQNVAAILKKAGKDEIADMLVLNKLKIQKVITVVNKETKKVDVLKLGKF